MDFKMNLTDELRRTLLESAAWDRVGMRPLESNDTQQGVIEEGSEGYHEESDEEEGFDLEDIHALLSQLPEEQLLEHIDSVLSVVEAVTEVIEEEADEYYEEQDQWILLVRNLAFSTGFHCFVDQKRSCQISLEDFEGQILGDWECYKNVRLLG